MSCRRWSLLRGREAPEERDEPASPHIGHPAERQHCTHGVAGRPKPRRLARDGHRDVDAQAWLAQPVADRQRRAPVHRGCEPGVRCGELRLGSPSLQDAATVAASRSGRPPPRRSSSASSSSAPGCCRRDRGEGSRASAASASPGPRLASVRTRRSSASFATSRRHAPRSPSRPDPRLRCGVLTPGPGADRRPAVVSPVRPTSRRASLQGDVTKLGRGEEDDHLASRTPWGSSRAC